MAIRRNDVPRIIIERTAMAHPRPAYFGASEICDWPEGVLSELLRAGLLVEADQARTILCPGCEWQCNKAPTVRRDAAGRRRAYISCDEQPEHGRIRIAPDSLTQYRSNDRTLSNCVAYLLGYQDARPMGSGNAYKLGVVKGRHGERVVGLLFAETEIAVTVGKHSEPLLAVLTLSRSGLVVDGAAVKRLANRKESTSTSKVVSDRTRQQARKRATTTRDRRLLNRAKQLVQSGLNWSEAAEQIRGTDLAGALSGRRIRRIITEQRSIERKKKRSKR